jgi:hypothetical protein
MTEHSNNVIDLESAKKERRLRPGGTQPAPGCPISDDEFDRVLLRMQRWAEEDGDSETDPGKTTIYCGTAEGRNVRFVLIDDGDSKMYYEISP